MNKFFSIVIPVYNPTRLKRALDSIAAQKIDDMEVIVVDDNSVDKSYRELLDDYSFDIRLIVNERNAGPGVARQIGLDACTGDWVTFLDHDDEFIQGCFGKVKEQIEQTGCEFVMITDTLIADDYNWILSQNYQICHSVSFLHGKFYNRKKLQEYNIRFSDELTAQEDTFFCAQVEGYLSLDKRLGEQARIEYPLLTYCWYLWEDSTSHKMQGKISYLERTFAQYIRANFDAYKLLYAQYPDEEFKCGKLISLMDYCYWFYESFKYFNPEGYLQENLEYIRELARKMMEEFGLAYLVELEAIMMSRPDLYHITYETAKTITVGPFIPQDSLVDFIRSCAD